MSMLFYLFLDLEIDVKKTLGYMFLDLDKIKAFQSNVTKRVRVCKCVRKKGGGG